MHAELTELDEALAETERRDRASVGETAQTAHDVVEKMRSASIAAEQADRDRALLEQIPAELGTLPTDGTTQSAALRRASPQ